MTVASVVAAIAIERHALEPGFVARLEIAVDASCVGATHFHAHAMNAAMEQVRDEEQAIRVLFVNVMRGFTDVDDALAIKEPVDVG